MKYYNIYYAYMYIIKYPAESQQHNIETFKNYNY